MKREDIEAKFGEVFENWGLTEFETSEFWDVFNQIMEEVTEKWFAAGVKCVQKQKVDVAAVMGMFIKKQKSLQRRGYVC